MSPWTIVGLILCAGLVGLMLWGLCGLRLIRKEIEKMDQQDILKMAREAAAKHGHTLKDVPSPETMEFIIELVGMASAKAAQDEREACALICDQESAEWEDHSDIKAAWISSSLDDAADQIRARGQ